MGGRSRSCGSRGISWRIRSALSALSAVSALSACTHDNRTPVVLYSPHGRDQLELLERDFERRRPDIDVRWLDMGSQEILDRLRFERVNPQADVWFGGPTTTFAPTHQYHLGLWFADPAVTERRDLNVVIEAT